MPMLLRWHFHFLIPKSMPDAYYKIGFIMKPHGLKGEVTVALGTDVPEDMETIRTIFVEIGEKPLPFFIERISLKGDRAFLKLEDIDTPERAREISKASLYLPKSARPKSGRGEFYDDEVIGFEVTDTQHGTLGHVSEIVRAGTNKLLAVSDGDREVLIPLNSPFLNSTNKGKKKISVTLPEGFLEI